MTQLRTALPLRFALALPALAVALGTVPAQGVERIDTKEALERALVARYGSLESLYKHVYGRSLPGRPGKPFIGDGGPTSVSFDGNLEITAFEILPATHQQTLDRAAFQSAMIANCGTAISIPSGILHWQTTESWTATLTNATTIGHTGGVTLKKEFGVPKIGTVGAEIKYEFSYSATEERSKSDTVSRTIGGDFTFIVDRGRTGLAELRVEEVERTSPW